MAVGPSGGMLKKMFNPLNIKKKMKTSVGVAKAGGPQIANPTDKGGKTPKKPHLFGKK